MKRYLFTLLLIAAAGGCNRNATPSETAADNTDESQLYGSNATPTAGDENSAVRDDGVSEVTPPEHRTRDEIASTGEGLPDTSRSNNAATGSQTGTTANTGTTNNTGTTTAPGATTTNPNVARNTDNTAGTTARDNTGVNKRDRNDATLTPMDQGESEGDVKITQEIRRAIVDSDALSFSSKNVKVITRNGKVTLRGTVPNARERSIIEDAAKARAGVASVDNQLEVSK